MDRAKPECSFLERSAWLSAALSLSCCALALSMLSGCSREAGGSTPQERRPDSLDEPRRDHLVEAESVELRQTWRTNGVLQPAETARVAFLVGGRLIKILVKRGDLVSADQPLAQLDTAEVMAGVAQARAAITAAETQVELAEDALRRIEPLSQQDAIAGAQVVKVRLQLDGARAMRDQAVAASAMVRVKRDQHTLRAPIAGTVLIVPETLGEIVGPGIPQFEISQLDRLKLTGTLPAEAAGQVRAGQPVTIRPLSGSGALEGRIGTVLPALTADTHRLPIEVEIDAPPDRPGLANSYVEIEVAALEATSAASIPATALVREQETWVFVAHEGRVRRLQVKVLNNRGDHVVVQGVSPDSQVIDLPGVDLVDGAPLRR